MVIFGVSFTGNFFLAFPFAVALGEDISDGVTDELV
jgi:hypothetical protein